MQERLKTNKVLLNVKTSELKKTEEKLRSVEEKWINNQLSFEGYQRWDRELTQIY